MAITRQSFANTRNKRGFAKKNRMPSPAARVAAPSTLEHHAMGRHAWQSLPDIASSRPSTTPNRVKSRSPGLQRHFRGQTRRSRTSGAVGGRVKKKSTLPPIRTFPAFGRTRFTRWPQRPRITPGSRTPSQRRKGDLVARNSNHLLSFWGEVGGRRGQQACPGLHSLTVAAGLSGSAAASLTVVTLLRQHRLTTP